MLSVGNCFVLTQANGQVKHNLQAVFFESYLTESVAPGQAFDTVELPSAEFPVVFSRLFVAFGGPQELEVPQGFQLPPKPMFLDIFTFVVTDAQTKDKKRFSRLNDFQRLAYNIKFMSWSKDRYEIELGGRHEDLKFPTVVITAAADKTQFVRIRHSAHRTLYAALTPIEDDETPADLLMPKPIQRPPPQYPSELSRARFAGIVRVRCLVTREGRIHPGNFVILECPHYLFARSSLDVILNHWRFRPAMRSGVPVDLRMNVEVGFRLRGNIGRLEDP